MMGAVSIAAAVTPGRTAAAYARPDMRPGGEFDRYVAELAKNDQFSGTVMVAHQGKPVLARAYGMADKARKIPNRIDTQFNLASASKPFTALAVLQLVEQGRIDLHATVGTYLEGFPPGIAGTVTVHQLLTHTGGFADFRTDQVYKDNTEHNWNSERKMMDGIMSIIRREALLFTPGTQVQYSSSGMAALGAIVEAAGGGSFYDHVREHIFAAAGMTGAGFTTRPDWLENPKVAHPYWRDQDTGQWIDGLARRPPSLPTGHGGTTPYVGNGGGGAFATAEDLVAFDRALRAGRLLGAPYVDMFLTLKVPAAPAGDNVQVSGMGYGLTTTMYNRHWLAQHGGGLLAGGSTNWTIYRDLEWTTVILSNYAGIDLQNTILAKERAIIAGA